MEKERKKPMDFLLGAVAGLLNGLFGAGGGVAVVPLLEKTGIEPKKAHATSISIILPISLLSSMFYLLGGQVPLGDAVMYLPLGLVGAAVGSLLLKKLSNQLLRRIFGAVMILSAIRIWMR